MATRKNVTVADTADVSELTELNHRLAEEAAAATTADARAAAAGEPADDTGE